MTWKTMRLLVEVPVHGKITERDVRSELERAIERGGFVHILRETQPILVGRVRVKQLSRYNAGKRQ